MTWYSIKILAIMKCERHRSLSRYNIIINTWEKTWLRKINVFSTRFNLKRWKIKLLIRSFIGPSCVFLLLYHVYQLFSYGFFFDFIERYSIKKKSGIRNSISFLKKLRRIWMKKKGQYVNEKRNIPGEIESIFLATISMAKLNTENFVFSN